MRNDTGASRTAKCFAGVLIMSLLLAACATHRGPTVNEAAVRSFAARGYVAAENDSVTTSMHDWWMAGRNVHVVLATPGNAKAHPLVIYLPGMGEPAAAGERWRNAWASAGYVVLSIQPLLEDATAWQSDLARDGDFKTLGRQRYAGTAMSQRVRVLAEIVGEARRRGAAGEAPWQAIDWNRVAIAGFDLGAYTAMTVAGEHVRDADDASGRLSVAAAIALSPYASASAGSMDTRYKDMHAPVLSMTSDVDSDVLGLVESASLRDAPFERMAGPDKYLLSLRGLPHADFSGTPAAPQAGGGSSKHAQASGSDEGNNGGQRGRARKQRNSGDSAGQDVDRGHRDDEDGERLSPTAAQLRLVAVQNVSTAFLDAYLKGQPAAREWLAGGASRWLDESGELRRK